MILSSVVAHPQAWTLVSTGYAGQARFGANYQSGYSGYLTGIMVADMTTFNSVLTRDTYYWHDGETTYNVFNASGSTQMNLAKNVLDAGGTVSFALKCKDGTPDGGSVLHGGNGTLSANTGGAAELAAFGAFCASCANVSYMKGRGVIWSILNEWDLPPYSQTLYKSILQNVVGQMKAVDPDCIIACGGTSGGINGNTSTAYGATAANIGSLIDVVDWHNYNRTLAAEVNITLIRANVAQMNANMGITKPHFLSEWGWVDGDAGLSDASFSRYIPYLRTTPYMKYLACYAAQDDNPNHWGLCSSAGVVKSRGAIYRDLIAHANWAIGAKQYCVTGPSSDEYLKDYTACIYTGADGTQRGNFFMGSSASALVYNVIVRAQAAGTLNIQTPNGATTTQALTLGLNTVALTFSGTVQVLWSPDAGITFPQAV